MTIKTQWQCHLDAVHINNAVADPELDLRVGGVDFVTGGGGVENHWTEVEVKGIFSVFWPYFYLNYA